MPMFDRQEALRKGREAQLRVNVAAKSLLEAARRDFSFDREYDVFLSHSFLDAQEILGIREIIVELGFSVYVDWLEDSELDRSQVTVATAQRLRTRLASCRCLFFAVSVNSLGSVWTAWELGLFDGIKGKVAILPVVEQPTVSETYQGREYLGLYYYVTKTPDKGSGKMVLWINETATKYVSLHQWLAGKAPFERNS